MELVWLWGHCLSVKPLHDGQMFDSIHCPELPATAMQQPTITQAPVVQQNPTVLRERLIQTKAQAAVANSYQGIQTVDTKQQHLTSAASASLAAAAGSSEDPLSWLMPPPALLVAGTSSAPK